MITMQRINDTINTLLRTDSTVAAACAAQAGHVVAIEATDLNTRYCLHIHSDHITIERGDTTADTTIRGTSVALIKMALNSSQASHLDIHGNIHLAQWLQQLAQKTQIDWEALLAQHIPDGTAHQVVATSQRVKRWLGKQWQQLKRDCISYAQEEKDLLTSPIQIEQFYTDIAQLRDDTDRLSQRVERLKKAHD